MAKRPLALTLGDPAGIGPDITLLAWQARAAEAIPPFVWLGDPDTLATRADQLNLAVRIETVADAPEAAGRFAEALPVLPLTVACPVVPGRPDE
ncbi:MAG: 4-hydroxythreonine-4-phosphate dehydrogenase PdxA, partial [Methyloceanibacter sp.]